MISSELATVDETTFTTVIHAAIVLCASYGRHLKFCSHDIHMSDSSLLKTRSRGTVKI